MYKLSCSFYLLEIVGFYTGETLRALALLNPRTILTLSMPLHSHIFYLPNKVVHLHNNRPPLPRIRNQRLRKRQLHLHSAA